MNRLDSNMKLYKLIALSIAWSLSSPLWAQMEHNLFNLDYAPQSQWVNPAVTPTTKWHFGIGVLFNSSWPVSYNDVVSKRNGDTAYINGDNLLSNLGSNNHFNLGIIPDISAGVKVKKWYFSLGLKENIVMNLSAPKGVFEFLIKGNAQPNTIGQFQNIGDFKINGMHYREIFGGASYQFDPRWSFGARLKLLIGYENISTSKSDLSVRTDPTDYSLTLKSSYLIQTSGLDGTFSDRYKNGPFGSSGNTGFGIDLGSNYKYNDKISFSASILDLGFISWSNNNKVFRTKNENATYQYSGIDLYNLSSNSQNNYLDNLLDTIRKKFDLEEVRTSESYSTSLYTKMYLGGQYKYNDLFQFGALTSFTIVNGSLLPALSLYSKADLSKFFQAQLSYQMNQNSFANIGLGIVANLGPLQYYFMSDNIIGTTFAPLSSKNISFRTGFNIQWSQKKSAQSIDASKTPKTSSPLPKSSAKINDIDKDSVADELDYCYDVPGSISNNGCPLGVNVSRMDSHKILIFQLNKAELTPASTISFEKIVATLQSNPKAVVKLLVRCTTSEIQSEINLGLERTKKLSTLFESKDLMNRVKVFCKNANDPISKGDTPIEQMLNHSAEVEITLLK